MVMAGIALALVPGLPTFELSPELVLLFVLPPVIYSSGVSMSWREFRYNLRPIGLLAIGGVLFTTTALAVTLHYLLGLPWALGFLLGAIISPPDAIAPLAIMRELGAPRRLLVVLEGEGLVNDAIALVVYRFAVAAVVTGAFSMSAALARFGVIVVGELIYGLVVGWLSLRLRAWAHNPRIEIVMSLMTPYLAFWPPAHLGGSGVLATVATGLYVSWNGPLQISASTRLQGIFFWDLTVYLIDGLIFLYTGLQLRVLVEHVHIQRAALDAHHHRDHDGHRDRRALSVDVPGDVRAAVGEQEAARARPGADVACAVHGRVHRHSRRGVARRGARVADDRPATAGHFRIAICSCSSHLA